MKAEDHLYILSGLGADERVFDKIDWGVPHTYIQWIENERNESLVHYAKRLDAQIKHERPILLGLSFGGVMVQEISRIRPVKHLILLSSVGPEARIPWYFRLAGILRLPYVLPSAWFRHSNKLLDWMFEVKDSSSDLLREFIKSNKVSYLRWSLQHMADWKASPLDCSYTQIQCRNDRVIPLYLSRGYHYVLEGGHFSVYSQAKAAQELFRMILSEL